MNTWSIMSVCSLSFAACTVNNISTTNSNSDAGANDTSVSVEAGGTNLLGFRPSNVDLSGMDLSMVGDFVVSSSSCSIDSNELGASCGNGSDVLAFKTFAQPDGTTVAVYVARTINIPASSVLTVNGVNPIVLIALDTISIEGGLLLAAKGDLGNAGGASQEMNSTKGGGAGGGGAATTTTCTTQGTVSQ